MKKRTWIIASLAALAIAAIAAPVAQARQFEGEIVAHNAKAKTFKIREDQGGGTFKVKVTKSTFYQGISGFKAIRVGRTDLEVVAHKADGIWIASKVETRGGSGGGGNDDR
jgi:opacity protein-like surface antigen